MSELAPTKLDLIRWADDRREIDLVSKVILQKLAFFADAEGETWRRVEDLASDANCSVRTVQYRLRWLAERGYLAETGGRHRLKGSTRSVPTYLLGPSLEAVDNNVSMGANSAPIDGAWVQDPASMGATVCTPNETLESQEEQRRAREDLDEVYRAVENVYPRLGLGFTDPAMARRALADVLAQGVAGADLVAAAAAFAADPVLKRRDMGPVSLQRWLGDGRYRGWLPAGVGDAAEGAVGGAPAWAGPPDLRAAVLAALGAGFAGTLDRCEWNAAERVLFACTGWAHGKLAAIADVLEAHGAELGMLEKTFAAGGNR